MVDNNNNNVNLPPGFRFYPTDEELVVHFLHRKASLLPCHPDVIPDLDLYPFDPWQLQGILLIIFLTNSYYVTLNFIFYIYYLFMSVLILCVHYLMCVNN